jgi:uncharacterized Zn-binding protein involved in type VI secretion
MGQPAATKSHPVVAVDTHIVRVPPPGGPVPTPLPHPFSARLDGGLVDSVKIAGQPAAVKGSTATNSPAHIPTPPGTSFQRPPADKGTVQMASSTVLVGGKGAARLGDTVQTCNDPADAPVGSIVAGAATVTAG